MTKTATIGAGGIITCPKCSTSRVRDMRRVPVLMGIWFGCLAAIPVLTFGLYARAWLVIICCGQVALLVGWIFCRAAQRHAAQYECKDCRNRWRGTAEQ